MANEDKRDTEKVAVMVHFYHLREQEHTDVVIRNIVRKGFRPLRISDLKSTAIKRQCIRKRGEVLVMLGTRIRLTNGKFWTVCIPISTTKIGPFFTPHDRTWGRKWCFPAIPDQRKR